ncbi:hypothetical protein [Methylobacterium sp. WL116]|uniref:hypothetical protein n=1 Tax=Methylobacterium sp. WL116 TaxID=2603889 RepID=UPI0011CAB03B|nr:hypothetical protein [Methylobacterium sp. WL116]TXM91967.1 hypothetical protein FV223_13425 [Methylobacterium sp. WL116]
MHEAVLQLMCILASGIETEEASADQLGAIAAKASALGDDLIAKGLAAVARNHRVRALELQSELAAVSMTHGGIFHQHLTED